MTPRTLSGPHSERRAIRICVLLSVVLVGVAAGEWFNTAPRVFTGRWSAVSAFLFEQFGVAGLAARWLVLAGLLLWFARVLWRHANKVPGDRWYRR